MARPRKYATEEDAKAARRDKERERNRKRYADAKDKGTRRGGKGGWKQPEWQEWQPRFVGIDGESFVTDETLPDGTPKQAYCLLLRNDKEAIYNADGLSTWDCLRYLTDDVPAKTALVGYFLNFDFEWILKDLKQEDYKALQHGDTVDLFAGEYFVQWFVGKKLVVYRLKTWARRIPRSERKMAKHYRMVTFQDVQGFFQQSFVNALIKWGFKDDPRLEIITTGKAARGGFRREDVEDVAAYNKAEMDLLEELMQKVYDSFRAAYEAIGLDFRVNSQTWSGPGVFANDFLKQTLWKEEHENPSGDAIRKFARDKKPFFGNEIAQDYPFSLAYYGGRIELSGVGRFGAGYNYDINSAYPYALSLLPKWQPEDFEYTGYVGLVQSKRAKDFLARRVMGMYAVRFAFPEGWLWYPFPVRDYSYGSPNVFYPRQGVTHIMSTELFAVLDSLPASELANVEIIDAYILRDTDGHGDGLTRMPADKLSTTARKTLDMAAVRLKCKAAKKRLGTPAEQPEDALLATAEGALKLILNSLYGKTIQQIGSHKYYNDFAAAWITSTCRGLLWRAIAPERATDNVLMTMTDGLYSRVPLQFAAERETAALGDWEASAFDTMETFKPGIYRYGDSDGMHYKVRGFLTPTTEDKERLFGLIWQAVTRGDIGKFPARLFLTRNLALEGWKREPYCRQFYVDKKDIESELRAKRDPNDGDCWLIPDGRQHVFFEPKRSHDLNNSKGYALAFEDSRQPDSDEDTETYLMDYDARIGIEEFFNIE